jgi:beta-galactosidase
MIKTRNLLIIACILVTAGSYAQQKTRFNDDWEFVKNADTVYSASLLEKNSRLSWKKISLPHTANLEPIEKVEQQWQGICFYRKFFVVPAGYTDKHLAIQFDAAMQEADVYLNGQHVFNHKGGYLPFYIDVSGKLKTGEINSLVVRLDNRDNRLIPPGKPLKTLDFNYYSGIYRNAWLIVKDKLHITDAVASNTIAGGGVFVHYENISDRSATMVVQTEIKNENKVPGNAQVKITLKDKSGKIIVQSVSENTPVDGGVTKNIIQRVIISDPQLWSPQQPHLYDLSAELVSAGKTIDAEKIRTGIRTIRCEPGAFYLNGKQVKIRGTNRHQEYPWLGNAGSDNAQYRDAWKIKEAGFNFVRSSHYPQSPAFIDACDELGLMVMDAIPGWQFVGNEVFQQLSFQDIKDMIRRDRNHASIVLWEASLNESGMRRDYMEKAHKIVHEELPFEGVYSAGWIDNVYDVFLPARQHGKAPDYWRKYSKNKPFIIAEYGDWEYYAQNAGFNQTAYKDLKPEERTSRQLRGFGEKRLIQQALNYQESHNDNLYSPAVGDANWVMFDYNRGYAQDIESSGIMDMVRLPKFSFYFYQSQIDPVINSPSVFNRPMLHIENYWDKNSDTTIRIFSNCDEVELFVNGKSLGRQKPDQDRYSTNLKHPPFTFHANGFTPGTLMAVGYINNRKTAEQVRKTPGEPVGIRLRVDYSNKPLEAGHGDFVFAYAEIVDANGTVVPGANNTISFTVSGDAELVGFQPIKAEAGIAAILVKAGTTKGKIRLSATGEQLKAAEILLDAK